MAQYQNDEASSCSQVVTDRVNQAVVVPVMAKTHSIKINRVPLTFHFCFSRWNMNAKVQEKIGVEKSQFYQAENVSCQLDKNMTFLTEPFYKMG